MYILCSVYACHAVHVIQWKLHSKHVQYFDYTFPPIMNHDSPSAKQFRQSKILTLQTIYSKIFAICNVYT